MSERTIPRVGPETGGIDPDVPAYVVPAPTVDSDVTSVANPGANTLVELIAAPSSPEARRGICVCNDQGVGTANLLLKLGAAASATSFTCKVNPNGYYETPFGYVGIVTAVWDATGGNARVTEILP